MHFSVISLSDFKNTIKLPAVDRRRRRRDGGKERAEYIMKNNLIYGIGVYHIQTKPDPLSLLNIQPFKGRSQVGSHPSHFMALPAPPLRPTPSYTFTPPSSMMLICCFHQTSLCRQCEELWIGGVGGLQQCVYFLYFMYVFLVSTQASTGTESSCG